MYEHNNINYRDYYQKILKLCIKVKEQKFKY